MSFKSLLSAGASAMILASATARAQDGPGGPAGGTGGPVIVGERPPLEYFRLGNVRAGLDLVGIWRREETETADGGRRRSSELEFRESLDLSTEAFVLHPNFLHLDMFGRFGLRQARTSLSGFETLLDEAPRDRRWESDILLEHDVVGRLLRESQTPITLHTRRQQSWYTRPFGETLDSVTSDHGARVTFRGIAAPTDLAFYRREQETSSRLGLSDFRIEQNTFRWDTQYQPTDSQSLTWSYTFDDVRQSAPRRPTLSFQRHNALLSHDWRFGKDREHQLRSSAFFFREDGELELTRFRLNENLRLRHSPALETRYDYTFDYTTRPGMDQTIHRGSAGFRHRLFESLTTVGNIGASRLTLEDGSEFTSDLLFADLELQYTKKVPYGRLAATLGGNISRQDDSDRDGAIQIIQEPHVFSTGGIIILQRRNIVPASIVITDAAGIFTFTQGLDYIVNDFVDRVEIRRILGGDIFDGQPVLISYRVEVEPANVTDTLGWHASLRYDIEEGWLSGLGVYGRYAEQDQSRRNHFDVLLPEADLRDLVVGADYRIGYFTFLGERQWRDSTLSPFRSTRLEARYAHPIARGSSLLLTGAYRDIDRYEDDIQTQILTLTGRLNHQFNYNWRMGVELQWRDERDRPGPHVRGFEQQIDVAWRHRQTSFFALLRNANLDSSGRDSNFQTFQLGIRREF